MTPTTKEKAKCLRMASKDEIIRRTVEEAAALSNFEETTNNSILPE